MMNHYKQLEFLQIPYYLYLLHNLKIHIIKEKLKWHRQFIQKMHLMQ